MGRVIHSPMGVSNEIIEIIFDYMLDIVKHEGHISLEGCSDVFKAKRNFPVCESTARTNKCRLVLILRFNLNLVIP